MGVRYRDSRNASNQSLRDSTVAYEFFEEWTRRRRCSVQRARSDPAARLELQMGPNPATASTRDGSPTRPSPKRRRPRRATLRRLYRSGFCNHPVNPNWNPSFQLLEGWHREVAFRRRSVDRGVCSFLCPARQIRQDVCPSVIGEQSYRRGTARFPSSHDRGKQRACRASAPLESPEPGTGKTTFLRSRFDYGRAAWRRAERLPLHALAACNLWAFSRACMEVRPHTGHIYPH